jgi:flagellar biosynthesis/type III secretory pathway chaperone
MAIVSKEIDLLVSRKHSLMRELEELETKIAELSRTKGKRQ